MTQTTRRHEHISVVIPTFNRAGYVVEAVESVLRQSEPPLEIIVVDDGSVDRTAEALAPYRDRIRYIRQENRGEAGARNRGIAAAHGEWVAFLDSDDRWEPHALQALRSASERYPQAGLIAMRARRMLPDGTLTSRISGEKKTSGPYFSTTSLLGVDSGGVQTPMVRRRLFEVAGGFDETLSAPDVDMWIRLSFHTTLVSVPEALLHWRMHEGNTSGDIATNARMWLRIIDKLACDRPDFIRTHRWAWRRASGKARLRLGRELLARVEEDASRLAEARLWLRRSVAAYPFFARTYLYLTWSCLAPRSYANWRRFERRWRLG